MSTSCVKTPFMRSITSVLTLSSASPHCEPTPPNTKPTTDGTPHASRCRSACAGRRRVTMVGWVDGWAEA